VNYLFAGVAAIALITGATGGSFVTHFFAQQDIQTCAAGIHKGDFSRCPRPITDAYATVTLSKEVVYRDRTIQVVTHDIAVRQADQTKLVEDLTSIQKTEDNGHACAASPAFVELRRQLRAEADSPDTSGS
jgi:hypothetical protein